MQDSRKDTVEKSDGFGITDREAIEREAEAREWAPSLDTIRMAQIMGVPIKRLARWEEAIARRAHLTRGEGA